jgi:hypothetical protein
MRAHFAILPLLLPATALAQVTISPNYVQAVPGQAIQFTASETGVVWQANNVIGGNAASGSVSGGGAFVAPATLPSPAAVTVTAVAPDGTTATATITLLAQAPTGTTYYVAPTGSDTNPGTITAPFATLQHASTIAVAGDTVLARAGVYNALFTPTHSGNTTAGPITFASYPGELATLDGTGLAVPNGQNGLITAQNVNDVIIEGFEVRNYTTSSIKYVPVGIYVTGADTGVQIVNNHVHNITTTAATTPAKCGSNALGMAFYGSKAPASINGLVIAGNEVDHLMTGCSESISIDGNVDGYAVLSNLVHDNNNIGIDSIGYEKVSPNPAYDMARNGEIRGNTVYNITSYGNPDYGNQYAADGLYVDGGTQIVLEQNTVYATDLGIELASEHKKHTTSYVTARNNLVFDNNSNGISIGGYGPIRGGSDHVTIVNNTLYNNDTKQTGSGEFQIQYYATNNIFQNNIVYAGSQGLFVHSYTKSEADPAVLNNNIYFGAIGAVKAAFEWNKKNVAGFTAYRSYSGQDAQSQFIDPLFVDAAALDLNIQATSPALDAGLDLGSTIVGTVDIGGNPRVVNGLISVGAYQQ